MIDRLDSDHRRIRVIADQFDTFLAADIAPVDPEFARLRWALLRELTTHSAAERHAWPAARACLSPAALRESLDDSLERAAQANVVEWTVDAMHADWPRYRAAARALLIKLRRRMAYEETVLFPPLRRALDGPGAITSRCNASE